MKMLEKMGFKGRLGKSEQGISAPIEVVVRPKMAGLGLVEEAASLKKNKEIARDFKGLQEGEEVVDSEDELDMGLRLIAEAKRELESSWKRPEKGGTQRKKKYKTVDELLQGAEDGTISSAYVGAYDNVGIHHAPATSQIIDMRGPEIKIVSSLSDIKLEGTTSSAAVVAQELVYNVRLLMDTAGNELNMALRKSATDKDKIKALDIDLEDCKENITTLNDRASLIKELDILIDRVSSTIKSSQSGGIHSSSLVNVFQLLQKKFKVFYGSQQLVWLAAEWLPPLISQELHEESWKAFENPDLLEAILGPWKLLLIEAHMEDESLSEGSLGASEAIYQHLLNGIVYSILKRQFMRKWTKNDSRTGTYLIESFISLSSTVEEGQKNASDVLATIVVPRLMQELDTWNPLKDEVGIHDWLLPWGKLVGKQAINQMLPVVRQKMSKALSSSWNVGDGSIQRLVKPWKDIWDARSMYGFLERCVIPQLIQETRRLIFVSRNNQPIDLLPFACIMSWMGILHSIQFNALLKGELFPRWLDALESWLYEDVPNKKKVESWYFAWKSIMPVTSSWIVDSSFSSALDIINRYFNKAERMSSRATSTNFEKALEEIRRNRAMHSMAVTDDYDDDEEGESELRFTDKASKSQRRELKVTEVIEIFASKNGVTFLPLPSRSYNGKQVYSFNSVNVFIDQNVVWMEDKVDMKSEWKPKSLRDILEIAQVKP
jgi:tuftelin-interacting protein 11